MINLKLKYKIVLKHKSEFETIAIIFVIILKNFQFCLVNVQLFSTPIDNSLIFSF